MAYRVLDSSTVLPQRRRRVYIVAIRADLSGACDTFRFPWLPLLARPLRDALEERMPQELQDALTVSENYWNKLRASRPYNERPHDIVANLDDPAAPLVASYGSTKALGGYAYVTQFVPQEGLRPRLLSQRECARLQGFPESFRIDRCADQHLAWYKRMGNAVSVPIVAAVADALLVALDMDGPLSDETPSEDRTALALPGTLVALLSALEACPELIMPQFLARQLELPDGSVSVSVATLMESLRGCN